MSEKITLWTIQAPEAWERCRRTGRLVPDGRRGWRHFRPAYRWLREQARSRLPGYAGGPLLWAWLRKPDLRRRQFSPGRPGVRFEFAVPRERVLCSDFSAWHCVLNLDYLALSEAEDDAWDRRLAERGLDWRHLPPAERRELEKSWERIFDLEALDASDWTGPVTHVQAVLELIRLEEVVRVDPFVSR